MVVLSSDCTVTRYRMGHLQKLLCLQTLRTTGLRCMRTAQRLTRQEHKLLHTRGPSQLLAQQRQQQPRAPALQQQCQDRHCRPGHLARSQERDEKA